MTRTSALPICVGVTALVITVLGTAAPATADPSPSPSVRIHHEPSSRLDAARGALSRVGSVVLVATVAKGADVQQVATRAEAGPGTVSHVLAPLRRVSVRVAGGEASAATARLRALPGVTSVTRAARRYVSDVPDDPSYVAHQASYLNSVAAPAAWSRTHGSSKVRIAVVDTGLDVHHPDLDDKVVATYNAHTGGTDVPDDVGHGTFVAGVAAAETGNGVGVAGAGYDTSILAAKVDVADPSNTEGGYAITSDDEAAGIKWAADQGANVINISLGAVGSDDTEKAAIEYAQGKGALIVAAAGNDGIQTENYPAAYPGVVAVGATDAAGHKASFSNYGSWVTLAAPGVGVYSTVPTTGSTLWPDDTTYADADGTSFSAPLVAGEAALLAARHPDASAATLRAALVASAHGYAGLGLGAGQVDFDKALDQFRPTTAPTDPVVDGDSGTITLQATSSAEAVRFSVDGTAVALAPATDGSARATFTSYGYANGTHTLTAVDCTTGGTCNTTTASHDFALDNAAPQLTSPVDQTRITGGFTFTATAPGGGVAFDVDGKQVAFDATAPYSVPFSGSALAEGRHTITAVQCSASGALCAGPASTPAVVTAESLHPVLTSVAPDPFSPNHDKIRDTATVTYSLPDTETVRVSVFGPAGTVVRGPGTLGTFAKGTRTWVWDGQDNRHAALPGGVYTVQLDTSAVVNGTAVSGQVRRSVTLDVAAPTLGSITGNRDVVYPVHDNYRDTFMPTTVVNERVTLYLQIRDARKRAIYTVRTLAGPGRAGLAWPGTDSAHRALPAGTYTWQFIADDAAGNRRATPSYAVTLSSKRLVTKSTVVTRNGDAGKYYGPDCTDIYASDYPHGVDMENSCDPTDSFEIISGFFQFPLPAAVGYVSFAATVRGSSHYYPSEIAGSFTRYDRDDVDISKVLRIPYGDTHSFALGSVPGPGHYTSSRLAEFAVLVDNAYTDNQYPSDFDIAAVSLTVTYRVLV